MSELRPATIRIGLVGTGVMGTSVARHLIRAGHPVSVFNRTPAKAAALASEGAQQVVSLADLARHSDMVITMVGTPTDVSMVYLGSEGLLANMSRGSLAIDMTTSSPGLARDIHRLAAERGIEALDAPVSGGDIGAREGRLSIMVGGEAGAFARALPIFSHLGKTIVHQGAAGAGQYAKLCNQIAIASGMLGVCEAITFARHGGLDPSRVLQSIEHGAAGSWSLSNLMPRAISGNFAPGFMVEHFVKDMEIALGVATEMDLQLPGLELARELYRRLVENGAGRQGTQALLRLYDQGNQGVPR